MAVILVLTVAGSAWLVFKVSVVRSELQSATRLIAKLESEIANDDSTAAASTVDSLIQHTGKARDAANDPVWKAAGVLPWIGPNLDAASEVATSADDVARLAAAPLVKIFRSLDWKALTPGYSGMDLAPLKASAPKVESAAYAVRESVERLHEIDTIHLIPEIAGPLEDARSRLAEVRDDLNVAADSAKIAPAMLGSESPRRYLLLMQNNAEARATGGIPGAVAVLRVDQGRLSLESQTSATALGAFVPPLPVDSEQQTIYSARLGKFMQDVNLTPDFATTATTARLMWEKRTGEQVDGVLSLDPVSLSFLLKATGPVQIKDAAIQELGQALPAQLTSQNVVKTLLSDVYKEIEDPDLQDAYFAGAAKEIFSALSSPSTDPKKLMDGVSKGVGERRILLWSSSLEEENTLSKYPLGGKISGPSQSPAQFGVFFNDGTGAKMDFWVKRSVQTVRDCTRDGYREITIKVTSTNTAPSDSAKSLPSYVTGGGHYGVPAGSVQTNVVAYGPVQATVDTVLRDGGQIPFAAQRHSQRPVGTSTIRLGPGESTTLEFNFGHIVQNAEAEVVVTPTTQAVKDVLLAPRLEPCE
ncbi:DUF4012 domain-containing protein [Paenarthrobacter sp. PAE-2]|uniref:DUF4012 domain-containing protein n=1 Tax=Paenarthrobacter sp. PAE-2 TaxID=2982532 RepID=UPI0029F466E2|nr:DUF4012 domain-containing protein [Paenarthrobacter sp. PAE-2]